MSHSEKNRDRPSLLRRIAQEPTSYFCAIALALFIGYGLTSPENSRLVTIDQREIDARLFIQEMNKGVPLSEQERTALTQAYIEEQILVLEAYERGLDNDSRIHDILAQKTRHVLSGDIIQPSETELTEFYASDQEKYRSLASVNLDEIVFDSREALSESLLAQLSSGAETTALLQLASCSAAPLPRVSHLDLANIFDPDLADRVFDASIGEWVGPYMSNRGQHWLKVTGKIPATLAPLDEIADLVRIDWITAEEESRLQQEIDTLKEKYTVEIINVTQ